MYIRLVRHTISPAKTESLSEGVACCAEVMRQYNFAAGSRCCHTRIGCYMKASRRGGWTRRT